MRFCSLKKLSRCTSPGENYGALNSLEVRGHAGLMKIPSVNQCYFEIHSRNYRGEREKKHHLYLRTIFWNISILIMHGSLIIGKVYYQNVLSLVRFIEPLQGEWEHQIMQIESRPYSAFCLSGYGKDWEHRVCVTERKNTCFRKMPCHFEMLAF